MPQNIEGTVYCVDRDRVTQARLAQLLSAQGLGCKTFASAENFLDSHSHAPPDAHGSPPGCLLLEVELPGMSGLDLQAALAAEGNTLPIIFLSSTTDLRAPIAALKAGALDFLLKPMEAGSLADAVRNALALDARNRQVRLLRAQILA
ncbi:MAG: response regulator, partial [Halioglobus sp.]|nr:response regulator [Halioglobus sp.]